MELNSLPVEFFFNIPNGTFVDVVTHLFKFKLTVNLNVSILFLCSPIDILQCRGCIELSFDNLLVNGISTVFTKSKHIQVHSSYCSLYYRGWTLFIMQWKPKWPRNYLQNQTTRSSFQLIISMTRSNIHKHIKAKEQLLLANNKIYSEQFQFRNWLITIHLGIMINISHGRIENHNTYIIASWKGRK